MRIHSGAPSQLPAGAFPYDLAEPLGRGASAAVYRARDLRTGARVALKVGHDARVRQLLADEAELLVFADSPGVARLVGAGLIPDSAGHAEGPAPGLPYLALEWVDGVALDPRHATTGDRAQMALAVARDAGDALASLHAMGVAHGDVKPSNVLLVNGSRAPRAVLVDLGLGAVVDEAVPRGGTVRYLPPESFDGANGGDARARDLWALGLLLAEIACADVAVATEPLSVLQTTSFSPELDAIVRPLLAAVPAARPSAEWAARRAREALGEPESAPERRERRRRAVRRAYFAVRRPEVLRAARGVDVRVGVSGIAGDWLRASTSLLAEIAVLRGAAADDARELGDLDALGRARWLTALVGSPAARWPAPRAE
ncbi:MAG TPA: protein kinase, partial [Polyangiaceae bacterium]|nr:protein kinase [Polyangiaceae bacterium]